MNKRALPLWRGRAAESDHSKRAAIAFVIFRFTVECGGSFHRQANERRVISLLALHAVMVVFAGFCVEMLARDGLLGSKQIVDCDHLPLRCKFPICRWATLALRASFAR